VSLPLGPSWFKGKGDPTASAEGVLSQFSMASNTSPDSLKALRRRIRDMRRDLSGTVARTSAEQAARLIGKLPVFDEARAIAAYLAFDGELIPAPILSLAWQQGKTVYMPVLRPDASMVFAPYTPNTPMKSNRYGIPEPDVPESRWLQARELDLVLTPLVAFDEVGYRLGMGGGFYDRTFAYRRTGSGGPCLLGLAFELQCHPVPHRDWDIPLDGVVTERRIYRFSERLG